MRLNQTMQKRTNCLTWLKLPNKPAQTADANVVKSSTYFWLQTYPLTGAQMPNAKFCLFGVDLKIYAFKLRLT